MTDIVTFLQSSEEFKGVPREQLEWLVRESQIIEYPAGLIFRPGDVFEEMLIILEGWLQAYTTQNGQKKIQQTAQTGTSTGLLPFSRMKSSPVFIDAMEPIKALSLHKSRFHDMMRENYELTEVMVHSMIDRVRHFTTSHFQDEKMMALGKLSAGVAHELNNPAAAIIRSAEDLNKTLGPLISNLETASAFQLTPEQIAKLSSVLKDNCPDDRSRLGLLERKRKEDELLDWLDAHGFDSEGSEALLEFGYQCEDIDRIEKIVGPETMPALLRWLSKNLDERKAIDEIAISARRISELVKSVKNYTRMDQVQDMQEVCINDGIRNTITMLEHKMRRNSITLHEELAENLPLISGFPGELNQVWTNIIDNALDAMKAGGELTIRTTSDAERVSFIALDTGPGIPPENLDRIFDPFFTTKDVGEGTGVGLDLVQKIVKQHHGTTNVTSKPGHTEFTIAFPVSKS